MRFKSGISIDDLRNVALRSNADLRAYEAFQEAVERIKDQAAEIESLKAQLAELKRKYPVTEWQIRAEVAEGFLKHFEKAEGSAYQAIKAQLAECQKLHLDAISMLQTEHERGYIRGTACSKFREDEAYKLWLESQKELAECRDKALEEAALKCDEIDAFFPNSPELHPLHQREKETAQDLALAIRSLKGENP